MIPDCGQKSLRNLCTCIAGYKNEDSDSAKWNLLRDTQKSRMLVRTTYLAEMRPC